MKKKILAVMAATVGVMSLVVVEPTFADGKTCPTGSLRAGESVKSLAECNLDKEQADENTLMKTVQTIINVVLGVLGIVTVAVIIIGGFQYVTSTGDVSKVTKAKNTIMYGVIGLIIALLAFAIVNFVLSNVFNGGGSGGGGSSSESSSSSTNGAGVNGGTNTTDSTTTNGSQTTSGSEDGSGVTQN